MIQSEPPFVSLHRNAKIHYRFIGDVHGKMREYNRLCDDFHRSHLWAFTLCVGDLAVGFPGVKNLPLGSNDMFIRGNHDNPDVCRDTPGYLGDYGINEHGVFFVSGADSIDKNRRTPGVDWWPDEQLSWEELSGACSTYSLEVPEIVVSHDCPQSLIPEMGKNYAPTQTRLALDAMLTINRPRLWVFGHHHLSFDKTIDGCRFVCLNELETLDINI